MFKLMCFFICITFCIVKGENSSNFSSTNNNCKQYSDCFNCTINNMTKQNCLWNSNGICEYSNRNSLFADDIWWNDFGSCKVFLEAEQTMLNYCGNTNLHAPFNLQLFPYNNSFGAMNLFVVGILFSIQQLQTTNLNL